MPATHTGDCNSAVGPAALCRGSAGRAKPREGCSRWSCTETGMGNERMEQVGERGCRGTDSCSNKQVYRGALRTFISPSLATSAQHRWDGALVASPPCPLPVRSRPSSGYGVTGWWGERGAQCHTHPPGPFPASWPWAPGELITREFAAKSPLQLGRGH